MNNAPNTHKALGALFQKIMPIGVYTRKIKRGGWKLSEITKQRIGLANKGKQFSEERKEKISQSLLGRKLSKEHREKIRQNNLKNPRRYWLGKKRPDISRIMSIYNKKIGRRPLRKIGTQSWNKNKKCPQLCGEKNGIWKGDNVSYSGLHYWVSYHLGKPDTCEFCGQNGLSGKQIHWANKSGDYLRDLNDWLRLCVSCHIKYDLEEIKVS